MNETDIRRETRKIRYIITTTDPDSLSDDDSDFEETTLEYCEVFTSRSKAFAEFKQLVGNTNMRVLMLKVEQILVADGRLK